ncbi:PREDICTED: uncharacterized protein LOC106329440 isoform X1 [Brassica oleracea var. oleracea]|uniref:uncharacterized protein LOC106329440 isoform X1 n=1 Tax=Brassica oleracea var. oleracea TaxID=109376 RepID=UPI0006A715CA|nr:PREDICTED: uncharacterized protein LOC106329440 isoform X1 [Brassica oleracea var. oleracea]
MVETPSKIHQLLLLHSLIFFLTLSPSTQQEQETHHCSKINTTNLFLSPFSNQSIVAANLITCRSGRLYFKTSVGLFHVSSIDYTTKTLILSHSSGREKKVKKLGTRVSLEVEGHLPDLCIACERPDGNCGVALRCLCHPKECKNKVVNYATKSRALLSGMSSIETKTTKSDFSVRYRHHLLRHPHN